MHWPHGPRGSLSGARRWDRFADEQTGLFDPLADTMSGMEVLMLRFSIRDVLWLTVVVAMVCAWHLERREARRQQLEDRAKLSAQESELKRKAAQLTIMQDVLNAARDEAKTVRKQLVEFVATQEDQAKIDVGPGLFHRVGAPQ